MELSYTLCIYLIIVFVIIVILCRYGYRPWSAIIIAILVGFVLLNVLTPPSEIQSDQESGSVYAAYMLIQILTLIVVIIYAFVTAIKDKDADVIMVRVPHH